MMIKSSSPHFITIEGGEGAGKSTLIAGLKDALLSWGIPVIVTREPGGTLFGNQVRAMLLNHDPLVKIGPKAELLLFLSARAQHIEDTIVPGLKEGKVIICDRFNDSTIAYQGAGRHLGVSYVKDLCQKVCGTTLPDLTFYLDVDPYIGLKRTRRTIKENASAGEVDRIEAENVEFHQRVREAFLTLAKAEPGRFCWIDANQSQKSVLEMSLELLKERFVRESTDV